MTTTITEFHPNIQAAIKFFSGTTLQQIGDESHVTKQAIHKKVQKAAEYFRHYGDNVPAVNQAYAQNERDQRLIQHLRQELILVGVENRLLRLFHSDILKFFQRFKSKQLPAIEKKHILDQLVKFTKAGGLIKNFAKRIGRSMDTLNRWQKSYEKYGLAGLEPKTTRPKHFGNKLPLWVKDQLLLLFLRFPRWTPYQYHSYIRHNPATHWYVSLPTITKLKEIHRLRTEEEKQRQKKRWCFAKGTNAWTVDFTCIIKTENFKLQLLTISDHRSRFLFPSALFLNTSTETVVDYLEELFLKFGKPMIIKVDNGPEFRIECREKLNNLCVYLLNSPQYYAPFNGAHERIHRQLKTFIDDFNTHHNLMKILEEVRSFEQEHNYSMPLDYLDGQTPANVYFDNGQFMPKNVEVITPYEKEGELRMKFQNRDGLPARISMALIEKVLPPRKTL